VVKAPVFHPVRGRGLLRGECPGRVPWSRFRRYLPLPTSGEKFGRHPTQNVAGNGVASS
jgi:hypothetical protein